MPVFSVALRYLWAAPCTLVGAAAITQHLPFDAITLGHVVLARTPRAMRRLRRHERVHVRQCERWGPAFFAAYLLAGAWQWARGRRAYWDNPFEIEARGESATR